MMRVIASGSGPVGSDSGLMTRAYVPHVKPQPRVGRLVRDTVVVALEHMLEHRLFGRGSMEERHRRAELHRVDRAEDLQGGSTPRCQDDRGALAQARSQ